MTREVSAGNRGSDHNDPLLGELQHRQKPEVHPEQICFDFRFGVESETDGWARASKKRLAAQ